MVYSTHTPAMVLSDTSFVGLIHNFACRVHRCLNDFDLRKVELKKMNIFGIYLVENWKL